MKRLNKLCPRQEDPAVCSALQPSYVRVVPEETWRRIMRVLNAADKWTNGDASAGPIEDAVDALSEHLGKTHE